MCWDGVLDLQDHDPCNCASCSSFVTDDVFESLEPRLKKRSAAILAISNILSESPPVGHKPVSQSPHTRSAVNSLPCLCAADAASGVIDLSGSPGKAADAALAPPPTGVIDLVDSPCRATSAVVLSMPSPETLQSSLPLSPLPGVDEKLLNSSVEVLSAESQVWRYVAMPHLFPLSRLPQPLQAFAAPVTYASLLAAQMTAAPKCTVTARQFSDVSVLLTSAPSTLFPYWHFCRLLFQEVVKDAIAERIAPEGFLEYFSGIQRCGTHCAVTRSF